MDIIDFPFTRDFRSSTPKPRLPIKITNPHTGKTLLTYGLIDTGADECAIPAEYAVILGHDLHRGIKKNIITGAGETEAYGHTMDIETSGILIKNVVIDFMEGLPTVLLGVRSFLSRFILTVDYKNHSFSLIRHTPDKE